MIKNKTRINKMFGIFTLMLIVLMFALPASAIIQGSIPIKLKLTAKPSNIMVGEKSDVIVALLDENEEPIVAGYDIPIDFSTTLGFVPSSKIIYKGDKSLTTEFTSRVPGIAVISVKSKGLDGDTTSIAVVPSQPITPTLTPAETPAATGTFRTTPSEAPTISPVVIIGIIVLITLYLRKK